MKNFYAFFLLMIFAPEYLAETTSNPVVLDKLSKCKDWLVRYYVAQNSDTSIKTLDYLSQDKDLWVRCGVAGNPNCSERAYKYIMGLRLLEELNYINNNVT